MEEVAATEYPTRLKRFAQSFADICRDAVAVTMPAPANRLR
jgi:hypothetical protein